jgi:60 kDa SS-A/Ro ribonucleoprotein
MKLNVARKSNPIHTHEGARAVKIDTERQLMRTVMCCLLWEDTFYESGEDVGARIAKLVPQCRPEFVAACAFYARTSMKLRHAPLLLVREMARQPGHKFLVSEILRDVIQRPDELTEFLAIYWKNGRQPLSAQVKLGLAEAFMKFGEYALAKYDRDGPVKLRDVLFLSHAEPSEDQVEKKDGVFGAKQVERVYKDKTGKVLGKGLVWRHEGSLFEKVVNRTLKTPDTWEVELSAGADKKETFTRLMEEKKLGALAFLRNLRNMQQSGVDRALVAAYSETVNLERVLPFRFISAAKAVPQWEDLIEQAMYRSLAGMEKFPGRTALLIDGSGSMSGLVSAKSEISRRDAAIALAILLRELCEEVRVVGFSTNPWDIPPRRGFALRDAINAKVIPEYTMLGKAVRYVQGDGHYDRIIVVTDEQSQDNPPAPQGKGYIINVGVYQNGIGFGPWVTMTGWSEAILEFIREYEKEEK